jgi:hypothetical protein
MYYRKRGVQMKNITIVLILVVILASGGCIDNPDFGMGLNPQSRLDREPNLVAACQYENWLNTTHRVTVTTIDSVIYETKSDINWVCYYRDNHTSVQRIGAFKDTQSAANYIWYYYDHTMPLIRTV